MDPAAIPPSEGPGTGVITVEAPKPTLVEGQVTDTIGMGIEGVEVTLYRRAADGSRGEIIGKARTSQFGDFKITGEAEVKGRAWVVFTRAQFAELSREVELGGEEIPYLGENLQGQLELKGKVTSVANGVPVGHANMEIQTPGRDWKEHTNEAGEFHVKGLSPGPVELIVTADGFGREARRIQKVEDAGLQEIVMKPQRTVRITVQDDLGAPIEGALMEVLDAPRNDLRTVLTDKGGAARVEGLHFDATSLRVRLSREHYVSDTDFVRTIELPRDQTESECILKMERAGRVAGRVLEEKTEKPVYGARVIVGDTHKDSAPHAFTDTSGHYEIDGVKPGPIDVTVHASGYGPQMDRTVVRAGETVPLDLTVSVGRVVKGVIKDNQGEKVTVAIIQAESWRAKRSLGLAAISNGSGEFEIEDAPLDEFSLHVVAPGYDDAVVTVKPEATPLEVTLKKQEGGGGESPFAAGSLKVGEEVPDVTLRDLRGGAISLRSLKGKIVVIDFWATWCAPCIASLPDLAKAYSRFKSRDDFVMIGVSRDFDTPTATAFLDAHPEYAWRQVAGEEGGVPKVVEEFRVKFIPALFVIGTDGRVVASYLEAADLIDELEKLINKKPSSPE